MRIRPFSVLLPGVALLLFCGQPVLAQTGKLIVHATPPEAHIYADGEPVVEAKWHHICLTAGEHKIDLYNYGFKPESRTVTIEAHKTLVLTVALQPIPGNVNGPWGSITVLGTKHAAVLLNGKDPAVFYVGYGHEFDSEGHGKRELVVPPGHYLLTVQCCNDDPWSTELDVPANQRVIVDAYKGVGSTVAWPRSEQLQSLPRFNAAWPNVQVAVEKVSGQFTASSNQINCGDSAHLTWSSTGAGIAQLNGQTVGPSGDQTVQPTQNSDYKFTATGPGGTYTGTATVAVNTAIAATVNVSPQEVRYHKVGDKIDQQGGATVTWSAPNASTVSVNPFGSVGASGSRDVQAIPKATSGPIDETVTYTLNASNACGGSQTATASLHIVGSIEASAVNEAVLETKLSFNSIYYPTDKPTVKDPQSGLVSSQERRLDEIAANFKDYLTVRPEARLTLQAHADHRGSVAYNKALGQRRADLVKSYLVEHGIAPEKISTESFGKEQNLTSKQVEDLAAQNPNISPEERQRVDRNIDVFRMANNRRVDLSLSTTGQTSLQYFPYNSDDLNVLLGESKPAAKPVAKKPVKH